MRRGGDFRIGRGVVAALLALSAPLTLGACAGHSYAGIPLAPGAAAAELQDLAHRAQAGDKHAQLELGIRYEEGRGVARDLGRAKKLYRLAAADSGGATHVYAPAVGKHGQGRVVSVGGAARRSGLIEAKIRLEALQ